MSKGIKNYCTDKYMISVEEQYGFDSIKFTIKDTDIFISISTIRDLRQNFMEKGNDGKGVCMIDCEQFILNKVIEEYENKKIRCTCL